MRVLHSCNDPPGERSVLNILRHRLPAKKQRRPSESRHNMPHIIRIEINSAIIYFYFLVLLYEVTQRGCKNHFSLVSLPKYAFKFYPEC